ncbi:hypothetical protein Pcinc_025170 [Petrolisthes cinctipes]|uniref:Tetratricopeptide repeat protein 1 n=1 Tax=Petrolisthes cinctipes TaxID=88211 RepID=A0AAE1KE56_PETCI|nr:hypothetical protein Pcinc_025170 [Petrolisthes cinctipes]
MNSEDEESFQNTLSSISESSEQHHSQNVTRPTGKVDDDTDDDDWLPAHQHMQDTRRRRRRIRNRQKLENINNENDDDDDGDDSGKEDHSDTGAQENIHSFPKENKEEEEEDEGEEDFIDEEYLKDLELSMTEEDKTTKQAESLKHKDSGNNNFKSGKYIEAVWDYTAGLRVCPLSFPRDRAVLYGNRAAAKARLQRKKAAIKDCNQAVELDGGYTKVVLRRATLQEEEDLLDEALKDYQRVLELDPSCQEAVAAVRRLPNMINEKNEKLKEEMMGKLKDLGNMILRPFGLSTANFEMKQDPKSGGYNINFNQNTKS